MSRSVGWLWKEGATEAVLEFLEEAETGCRSSLMATIRPGEGGERARPALGCIFPSDLSSVTSLLFFCSFPLSGRYLGYRRSESPAMTEASRGRDMVMY